MARLIITKKTTKTTRKKRRKSQTKHCPVCGKFMK